MVFETVEIEKGAKTSKQVTASELEQLKRMKETLLELKTDEFIESNHYSVELVGKNNRLLFNYSMVEYFTFLDDMRDLGFTDEEVEDKIKLHPKVIAKTKEQEQ